MIGLVRLELPDEQAASCVACYEEKPSYMVPKTPKKYEPSQYNIVSRSFYVWVSSMWFVGPTVVLVSMVFYVAEKKVYGKGLSVPKPIEQKQAS